MFVLPLLLACVAEPASITFAGAPAVTVSSFDPVAVEKATVMDKDGKPIEGAIASVTIDPPAVATLAGDKITPVGNGEATVTAHLDKITASYKFVVAKPDRVEVADWIVPPPVGEQATIVATVYAGAATVECPTLKWSVDNAAVATLDGGDAHSTYFHAVTVGDFVVTATCNDVSGTRAGHTDPAAAPKP